MTNFNKEVQQEPRAARDTKEMEKSPQSQLVPSTQFLKESELRRGLELLLLAYRDLLSFNPKEIEPLGIGAAHYRALFLIKQHSEISVGSLYSLLGITKQSLGRVLDKLLKLDIITRLPDDRDRRQRRLALTPKGHEVEAKIFGQMGQKLSKAYAAVGQENVAGFWQTLLYLTNDNTKQVILGAHQIRKK